MLSLAINFLSQLLCLIFLKQLNLIVFKFCSLSVSQHIWMKQLWGHKFFIFLPKIWNSKKLLQETLVTLLYLLKWQFLMLKFSLILFFYARRACALKTRLFSPYLTFLWPLKDELSFLFQRKKPSFHSVWQNQYDPQIFFLCFFFHFFLFSAINCVVLSNKFFVPTSLLDFFEATKFICFQIL